LQHSFIEVLSNKHLQQKEINIVECTKNWKGFGTITIVLEGDKTGDGEKTVICMISFMFFVW